MADIFIDLDDEVKAKKEEILTTHYLLFLDKSGSMLGVRDATRDGVNKSIDKMKETAQKFPSQKFYISLVLFNDKEEVILWKKPLSELKHISKNMYNPDGYTSLYDVVSMRVNKLKDELKEDLKDLNVKVVVTIFTDGCDTSSKEYTHNNVAVMNAELQKTEQWTFSYVGANQDVSVVAASLNIPLSNAVSYNTSAKSMDKAFSNYGDSMLRYATARCSGQSVTKGLYGDKEEVLDVSDENNLTQEQEKLLNKMKNVKK